MITDKPLSAFGGKGLFTKEIEEALIANEIDVAVHSMKDMPTKLPEGLEISCLLPREDVRDAFISPKAARLAALPQGAVLGTSSLRRQAQVKRLRPDLSVITYRGNVDTRLRKLEEGVADATLLASAGLRRLGLEDRITALIETDEMLPAIAQGAIGIETRIGDARMQDAARAAARPATPASASRPSAPSSPNSTAPAARRSPGWRRSPAAPRFSRRDPRCPTAAGPTRPGARARRRRRRDGHRRRARIAAGRRPGVSAQRAVTDEARSSRGPPRMRGGRRSLSRRSAMRRIIRPLMEVEFPRLTPLRLQGVQGLIATSRNALARPCAQRRVRGGQAPARLLRRRRHGGASRANRLRPCHRRQGRGERPHPGHYLCDEAGGRSAALYHRPASGVRSGKALEGQGLRRAPRHHLRNARSGSDRQ